MTFLPWLDPILYSLGAILLVRLTLLGIRITERVSRRYPNDPRCDILANQNWELILQRDRELYPSGIEERERREVRWETLAFGVLAALFLLSHFAAYSLR